MRSKTIFLFQVVEENRLMDSGYQKYSQYVHKSYLNAIKELEGKGYKFKNLDDNSDEMFYKKTKNEWQNDFKQGKQVEMAWIKRLIMNKKEFE